MRVRYLDLLHGSHQHYCDRPCQWSPLSFSHGWSLKYWKRSATEFRQKLPQYYATFLAKPAVMRWVRFRGWRLESEEQAGDFVRIQLRFDAEEEALQFALSLGSDVEVLNPKPLRDKTLQAARDILRLYTG